MIRNRFFLIVSLLSAGFITLSANAYPSAKLDPYSATFTVLKDGSSAWSDIRATIQFTIHNPSRGSLVGSKFICREDITSIRVTDGAGQQLPYTIKEYPRKRIIWEYNEPVNGMRTVKISFVMRNAVKKSGNAFKIRIDWVSGWTRPVLNARYRIHLPDRVAKGDIISIKPDNYTVRRAAEGTIIDYSFDRLKKGVLEIVIKQKAAVKNQTSMRPGETSRHIMKGMRLAPHDPRTDRLVFDFNAVPRYQVVHDAGDDDAEIIFANQVSIDSAVMAQKKLTSRRISGISWKKDTGGRMSCIVHLKNPRVKIRYGKLYKPPRVYIDVRELSIKKKREKSLTTTTAKEIQKKAVVPAPAVRNQSPGTDRITETDISALPTTSTTTSTITILKKEPPIEQKLDYMKARKLFKLGDFVNAAKAYREFLSSYPDTALREDIYYEIADCFYGAAEREDHYYNEAIEAYKKAAAMFPDSEKAPRAAFRVAECFRRQEFYIEAKSQYRFVKETYPESSYAVQSAFWIGECLYHMKKFKSALDAFQQYLDENPSGPHVKEASFRIADCYFQLKDYDRAEFYYERAIKKWPDMVSLAVDTLNNMAETYYYKSKFAESRRAFFLSFNLYPDQGDRAHILRFIGDAYQWEGKMQQALSIYISLAGMFPESPEAVVGVMRIADLGINVEGLADGEFMFKGFSPYKNPEAAYRWAISSDKTGELLAEAYYKLGFTLAKNDQYAQAVRFFKKSMLREEKGIYYKKSFENVQKILVKMIAGLADDNDYYTLVELYTRHKDPFLMPLGNCDFHYTVAKAFEELGLNDKAASHYEGIIARGKSNPCEQKAVVSLSRIYRDQGQLEKAERGLRILLYGSGDLPDEVARDASHVLGDVYYRKAQYQDAIDTYNDALKEHSVSRRYMQSLYRIGESFGKIGYYYNGIKALERMVAMANKIAENEKIPQSAYQAQLLIGDYLTERGNTGAAIARYSQLAKSRAADELRGWAYIKWGRALKESGDTERAAQVYGQAAELLPYAFLGTVAQQEIDELRFAESIPQDLKPLL